MFSARFPQCFNAFSMRKQHEPFYQCNLCKKNTNPSILPSSRCCPYGVQVGFLGSVTWSPSIFRFLETFFGHASRNKICGSTNLIIFGLTNQKLWVFENLRRSMGRAGMCWNQPTRIDYVSPKRWAIGIRNFEKSPLRVSSPTF
jgi:hypothetical protein